MTRGTKGSSRAKAKGQAKSSQFASEVLGLVRLMEKSSMDYRQKVKRLEQFGSTFSTMQNLLNGKHPDETDLREIWSILACHAMSTRDIHDKWIEDMEQKEKGKIESHQYTESEKEKRLEKLADWKNKEMRLQNLTEKPQFWAGFGLNANQMLGFVNEIQDQLAAARARLDEKKAREDREHINSLHEGAISDIESERDAAQAVGQMAENVKAARAGAEKTQTAVEAITPTIKQTAADAATAARMANGIQNPVDKEAAAELCGVTERTIRNWISGRGTPRNWPGLVSFEAVKTFADSYTAFRGANRAIKKQPERYNPNLLRHNPQ